MGGNFCSYFMKSFIDSSLMRITNFLDFILNREILISWELLFLWCSVIFSSLYCHHVIWFFLFCRVQCSGLDFSPRYRCVCVSSFYLNFLCLEGFHLLRELFPMCVLVSWCCGNLIRNVTPPFPHASCSGGRGREKGVHMINSPLTSHETKNPPSSWGEWLPSLLFRTVLFLIQEPDSGQGWHKVHLYGQVFFPSLFWI